MKKRFILYITLLFQIFLIKEISSFEEEILNKYGSIKTKYSSMILNTSEFERGEDIFIKLESDSNCDEFIRYQFYDNINEIYNQTSDLKFSLRAQSRSVTHILGKKTHLSLFYTINKNRIDLDNSEGNILYFEFRCEGDVVIKNTKTNTTIVFVIIAFIIVILFFIIFCFAIIKGLFYSFYCLKFLFGERNSFNINAIPNSLVMNAPQSRIVYIPQNQNLNQNNNLINQNNRNVVYQNNRNYIARPQYPQHQQRNAQNSSSSEIMNSTDRNLIPGNS